MTIEDVETIVSTRGICRQDQRSMRLPPRAIGLAGSAAPAPPPASTWAPCFELRALTASPSIGSSSPIGALPSLALCSWSCQFLSMVRSPRAAPPQPRGGRSALAGERTWEGASCAGSLSVTTDALFAWQVEWKVSNLLAHFRSARSFLDQTNRELNGAAWSCRIVPLHIQVRIRCTQW